MTHPELTNEPRNLTECRDHPVYHLTWAALEVLHDLADGSYDSAQATIGTIYCGKNAHIAKQAEADFAYSLRDYSGEDVFRSI